MIQALTQPSMVLSMSAIQAFKRCPRSFFYSYYMGLDPVGTINTAVEDGRALHEILAAVAKGEKLDEKYAANAPMIDVARAYLRHKPLPSGVLSVEEPFYVLLYEGLPKIWLRCTFDLVYIADDTHFARWRDYKSFERAPSLDLDLDFQARIYSAALYRFAHQRGVEVDGVEGEMEYIRRMPPGSKNSKGVWGVDECYINVPLVYSRRELDELWRETQVVAQTIVGYIETYQKDSLDMFYRSDLKVGPHSCNSCFVRNVCKTDLQLGGLGDQDLDYLATKKKYETTTLPDGTIAITEVSR